jgi:hypothetical protein
MHYPSFVEVPLIDIDFADELVVLLSTAAERSANFRLRARIDETEYHVQ